MSRKRKSAMNTDMRLDWQHYGSEFISLASELCSQEEFSDVTLACKGGITIEAHKFVLAASSDHFRSILTELKRVPHPVIYMRSCTPEELRAVLEFIYLGSVTLQQEEVRSFLQFAKDLGIKGLEEVVLQNNIEESHQESSHIHVGRKRQRSTEQDSEAVNDWYGEVMNNSNSEFPVRMKLDKKLTEIKTEQSEMEANLNATKDDLKSPREACQRNVSDNCDNINWDQLEVIENVTDNRRPCLALDGHLFSMSKATERRKYFNCVRRYDPDGCPATIRIAPDLDPTTARFTEPHNHLPYPNDLERRRVQIEVQKRGAARPLEKPMDIVNEVLNEVPEYLKQYLPPKSSLRRDVLRGRQRFSNLIPDEQTESTKGAN